MADIRAAPAMAAEAEERKKVVVAAAAAWAVRHEWAVRHVAAAAAEGAELVVVHGKPSASSVVSFGSPGAGPAAGDVVRIVEADLRKRAEDVVDRARSLCVANSVHCLIEVMEGEARYVLRDAVEKHGADLLIVGSHGYGAIKSVSDYCAHHAHCSVVIVKQPKPKDMMPAVPIPLSNRGIL